MYREDGDYSTRLSATAPFITGLAAVEIDKENFYGLIKLPVSLEGASLVERGNLLHLYRRSMMYTRTGVEHLVRCWMPQNGVLRSATGLLSPLDSLVHRAGANFYKANGQC